MVLLPDELDIIVDGLLADVRKVRIMFPQVVANHQVLPRPGKRRGEACSQAGSNQEEKIFQIGEAASAAFLFAPHPDWFCVHADGPTRPFSGMFPLLAAVGYKWPTDRQEKHLVHPISFLE